MTTRFLFGLTVLALTQAATHCLGMSYSITGNLSYRVSIPRQEGKPPEEQTYLCGFEAHVDDFAWKIRLVSVGDTNHDSDICSYDGTNLLHYFIPAKSVRTDLLPSAKLEEAPVPVSHSVAAGEYVWLAFASGQYLKAKTNGTMLSFEQLRSSKGLLKRYERPYRAVLSPAPPYLPTAVQFIVTNQAVFVGEDGSLTYTPLPRAFGNAGFISGVFRSDLFTNVNGFSFPTKFEYDKYQPRQGNSTTIGFSRVLAIRGMVEKVSSSEQKVDCRLPARDFMIHDLRVLEPNVKYIIHDGLISGTNSAIVAVAREKARRRVHRRE
jgi:hypothetical protein